MEKKWGKGEYWGLGSLYDQDWVLTEEQKTLRNKLMEVCRTTIRPHAVHCDKTYEFPRKSLDALADLGLLGLIVPKEFGGLGESHVGAAMVVETLARYGCPSTALVYVMHIGAVATLMFQYSSNPKLQNLLSRLDKDKLVGTLAYSDPATGGHFWYFLSAKSKFIDENTLKILKYCSWTTSAGHADWYSIQTPSPEFNGNFTDLSNFLIYKEEVRTSNNDWSSLGMHGNQSCPMVIEGKFNIDRLIGSIGDGKKINAECVVPYFLLLTSACWNGISMSCMDVAKKHVTRKAHADVGMRVCDYPTIQDYFGECVASTSVSRSHVLIAAQYLDTVTNSRDLSLVPDFKNIPKSQCENWLWISKFASSKNVIEVSTTMLHACGGSGYKTDLGLERLLRDCHAGWVMAPSNEVMKQFIGKSSLLGLEEIDIWETRCNDRVLHHELDKLSIDSKKALAQKILSEVTTLEESSGTKAPGFQDTDFENPFNTSPPTYFDKVVTTEDGIAHAPSLNPSNFVELQLLSRKSLGNDFTSFTFSLSNPTDHTGCMVGQYVQVKVQSNGKSHERYFSPVSRPDEFGKLELVLKSETLGFMSTFLEQLKTGSRVSFLGPCGGFEYEPNQLNELTLIASGGGVTPAIQIIRCIVHEPSDMTRVNLLYYSDTFDDILFREELDNYAATDPRVRVTHTLGEVLEEWDGEEGFISTELIDKWVTKPDKGIKHKIVMCGGSTMAVSCLHSLRSLNFPSDKIFIYGQLGMEQMKAVYGRGVKFSGHRSDSLI